MPEKSLPSNQKENQKKDQVPTAKPLADQKSRLLSQPQKQSQNEVSLGTGLNLITGFQQDRLAPERTKKNAVLLRSFIIIASVVFGALIVINYLLILTINYQKKTQERLIRTVSSYAEVEERGRSIDEKTIFYKKTLNEKREISSKAGFITENLGYDVELRNLLLDHNSFSLSIRGATPFTFASLIARYLEGDVVSEVVIKTASLNAMEGNFDVVMEGSFR